MDIIKILKMIRKFALKTVDCIIKIALLVHGNALSTVPITSKIQ